MAAPLVEALDVYFSWPTGPAVKGVSFVAAAGEMVAVVGPNGAGKSTLLRLLSGYLKPDRGEVRLAGRAISGYGRRDVARLWPSTMRRNLSLRILKSRPWASMKAVTAYLIWSAWLVLTSRFPRQ